MKRKDIAVITLLMHGTISYIYLVKFCERTISDNREEMPIEIAKRSIPRDETFPSDFSRKSSTAIIETENSFSRASPFLHLSNVNTARETNKFSKRSTVGRGNSKSGAF